MKRLHATFLFPVSEIDKSPISPHYLAWTVKMQFSHFVVALSFASFVRAVTCGWDGNTLKTDCAELLRVLIKGSATDLGKYDYKKCHIIMSKVGAVVKRNTYLNALKQCLETCNKFEGIYCRYPELLSSTGGTTDLIVGSHP